MWHWLNHLSHQRVDRDAPHTTRPGQGLVSTRFYPFRIMGGHYYSSDLIVEIFVWKTRMEGCGILVQRPHSI